MSSVSNIPIPANEPVLGYAPGSAERSALKDALAHMRGETIEIPCVVGGEEVRSACVRERP